MAVLSHERLLYPCHKLTLANMKKWYKIMFIEFFCKYLYQAKTRTHIGILGQHLMYLGLFQPFKTTNSAENQEKHKK